MSKAKTIIPAVLKAMGGAAEELHAKTAATGRVKKETFQLMAAALKSAAGLPKHVMAPFLAISYGLLTSLAPQQSIVPSTPAATVTNDAPTAPSLGAGKNTTTVRRAAAPTPQAHPKPPSFAETEDENK